MTETRVLVIADNLLARVGLSTLLNTQPEIYVVGQVAGGDSLADDLDIYRPDVVVYDLGYNPLVALPRLDPLYEARLPLVALLPDAEYAVRAAHVLAGGPYGLMLRETSGPLLTAALVAAAAGLVVLDPALAASLTPLGESLPQDPPGDDLTPRETEVLQLMAQGMTNKAIAHALNISPNTVKFHINAILSKLDAQSRTDAVVRATRLGLVIL